MEVLTINYDYNEDIFRDEWGIEFDILSIMTYQQIDHYKRVGGTYSIAIKEDNIIYEVDFPTSNGLNRNIIYWKADNLFTDEEGEVLFNIFSLLTPSDIYLFKRNKESVVIWGLQGGNVSIIYSEYQSSNRFYR